MPPSGPPARPGLGLEPAGGAGDRDQDGEAREIDRRHREGAAVAAADEANRYLDDAAFDAALAQLGAPDAPPPPKPAKVVRGQFGGLQPKRKAEAEPRLGATTYLTPEMLENLDRGIGFKPALGSGQ